jgi:fructokinase
MSKLKCRPARPVVIGLGEILWDLLPGGRQLGGAPANFAYHAAALGACAAVVSRVGRDPDGRAILARLARLGLGRRYVTVDPAHPTGVVEVAVDRGGKPRYTIREDAAWDHILFTPVLARLAPRADAVCFGTLSQRAPESRAALQQFLRRTRPNCLRIFDLNLRQSYFTPGLVRRLLSLSTVLKLNDEELPVLGRLLGLGGPARTLPDRILHAFPLHLLALTRGSRGSLLQSRSERHVEPVHPAVVADTVGAGDSFSAVLALGLLQGWPLARINRAANRLAAFVCSRRGATPALPASLVRSILGDGPAHEGS